MKAKHAFFAMVGAIAFIAIGLLGVTYLAQKLIVSEGEKLYDQKVQQAALDQRAQDLQQAKRDVEELSDLEEIAKTIVPQEKDQVRTILEIVNIARDNNIKLTSINFPASELGQVLGKGKAKANPNLTQLTPVEGLKGVYAMDINVTSNPASPVEYYQFLSFLRDLQNNRRTSQIVNLSINPNDVNRNTLTFTMTIRSYVKP